MKHILLSSIKTILADRLIALICLGIILGGLIYIAYVAISLSPSDLQIATRYTSFGETQYYRSNWYYLLSFIGLGLIYIAAHLGIIVKLYMSELRQLSYAFAALSAVMLVLMFIYTHSVLSIAYLS